MLNLHGKYKTFHLLRGHFGYANLLISDVNQGNPPETKHLQNQSCHRFNLLTAGAAYIRVFIFYKHIKYHILNMVKIKSTSKI